MSMVEPPKGIETWTPGLGASTITTRSKKISSNPREYQVSANVNSTENPSGYQVILVNV